MHTSAVTVQSAGPCVVLKISVVKCGEGLNDDFCVCNNEMNFKLTVPCIVIQC